MVLATDESENTKRLALEGRGSECAAKVPVDKLLRLNYQGLAHVAEWFFKDRENQVRVDWSGNTSDCPLRFSNSDWRSVVLQPGEHVICLLESLD